MRSDKKKALIFGSAGFAGYYLMRELVTNGYEVAGFDRMDPERGDEDYSAFVCGDLLDAGFVAKTIEECAPDIIINLAAISSVGLSWRIPQDTMSVNVNGTLNILNAVKELDPGIRVLLVGSSEEYAPTDKAISEDMPLDASNPYGISKQAQERFAKLYRESYGMKIYCIRAFNHTGVGQRETFVLPSFVKQAVEIKKSGNAGVIKTGNIEVERDFSDVRDVVRAYRMVIESEDCEIIYNIGSGKCHRLRELLEFIIKECGADAVIEQDNTLIRKTDVPRICSDNSLIKKQLGWEPEYEIFDTLKEMIESIKA